MEQSRTAFGFSILRYLEVEGTVPSTFLSHHSLIIVVEPFVLHLFLLHDCFLPSWVIVTRPIEIDDI
jgi:hypothetical protein